MNRIHVVLLVLVCLLCSTHLFAVGDAAILSLLFSPSPQANAMGQSYGTLWHSDPMSGLYNPAAIGLQAQNTFASSAFYPEKNLLLPEYGSDMWFNSTAFNIGFNLMSVSNIPVSLGFGYFNAKMNLGDQIYTDETGAVLGLVNSYEKYNSLIFSAAVDYYLRLSFGYTHKQIDSNLGVVTFGGTEARVEPTAHDWGFILEAPICDIMRKIDKPLVNFAKIQPFLTPGFYVSKRNIGDEVQHIEGNYADALPRQAYIGANVQAGLRFKNKRTEFDIFHIRLSREMDDMLIKREDSGEWEYLSGLNDIKFWDNVILGKKNDSAIKHQGYQIGLADVAFFRRGRYNDIEGKVKFESRGYGVNFTQPLRILASLLDYQRDKTWLNILLSIDVEYHESHWDRKDNFALLNSDYKGISLKLRAFEF
jgi:hypothetical protein